jgi:hypothetical protein
VPIAELKFLLNHAAGNVTMGYLNPSLDHLRAWQEKASAKVLDALGLTWTAGESSRERTAAASARPRPCRSRSHTKPSSSECCSGVLKKGRHYGRPYPFSGLDAANS